MSSFYYDVLKDDICFHFQSVWGNEEKLISSSDGP